VQDSGLTPRSRAVKARKMKIVQSLVIHDPSPECELEPWLEEPDENARFTPPINFFILHSTCNNNTQQQVPSTLVVSVSISRMGGRKQRVV
jgi:hypothetical protein